MLKALLFQLLLASVLFVSTGADAETKQTLHLYPGEYYAQTHTVRFEEGTMRLHVRNNGPEAVHYYLFVQCDYFECPVVTSGMVRPGKETLDVRKIRKGDYLFKLESPYGRSHSVGSVSQGAENGRK